MRISLKRMPGGYCVKFFSGFSFRDEKELFGDYLIENDFSVAGFSKGAIDAVEYLLGTKRRVDLLQLFSPAYFNTKEESFKRAQSLAFKKSPQRYLESFYKTCIGDSDIDIESFKSEGSSQELDSLLHYEWSAAKLEEIGARGVKVEVYLGERDEIVDSVSALAFFEKYAQVWYIRGVGHLLR